MKHGGVYTSHPDGQLAVQISDPAVVNVNSFQGVDRTDFNSSVTDFDGESIGDRLERRKQKWIAQVRMELGCN